MSTCCGSRCRLGSGSFDSLCPEAECTWCDVRRGLIELSDTQLTSLQASLPLKPLTKEQVDLIIPPLLVERGTYLGLDREEV